MVEVGEAVKIWAQTLCHNEENFIWYALMSVVDQVDKILVWDTGSTDRSVELIKQVAELKPGKIEFKECGLVDRAGVTRLRQEMLEESECDWILILDGDEVWWRQSINDLVSVIQREGVRIDGVVVPFKVPIGDIYHLQTDSAGRYELMGRKGHFNVRVINRRIKGLHVKNDYPLEGYYDSEGQLIQESPRLVYVDSPYLHVTHLQRSSRRRVDNKIKFEIGEHYTGRLPEVFLGVRPKIVSDPTKRMSFWYRIRAVIETPLKKIKRGLL